MASTPIRPRAEQTPNPFHSTAALDEVLLDVAVLIELSPRDRRVAENRFRLLKTHLERPASALAPYLIEGSRIYAQGSIASSTTIVSGTEDDRFDVDAIVEIDVPVGWDDDTALDMLELALQGFPGAIEIVRCTRCVTLRFPFMHMDVTILDRRKRIAVERAGEIFHSPDEGPSYRVESNPWGFTRWFRGAMKAGQQLFTDSVALRRAATSRDRLVVLDAERRALGHSLEQDDLPPMIPSRLDAQEAVALKLLKRFVNLHYETSSLRRPPSIYLARRAGQIGFFPQGLGVQLYMLAATTAEILRGHLASGTRPQEVNPSYPPDRINDRWPAAGAQGERDMRGCVEALEVLCRGLETMLAGSLSEIAERIDDLFGERIGKEARRVLANRYDRRAGATPNLAQPRTGAIGAPAIIAAPATARAVPEHRFHPYFLGDENGS